MRLRPGQLNRATLARQLLLRREPLTAVEGVRRVMALQAQEPASPYLALWNRLAGFDPADLDAAYTGGAVVKATLMRITLHAVTAEDYPVFQSALVGALRGPRLGDRRFAETGLSAAAVDAVLPEVLAFVAEPRSNGEVEAMLAARFGEPKPRVWWALRAFAPVRHAPTGQPWSFGPRPAYLAAAAAPHPHDRRESAQVLARRYLAAFGPAGVEDFAQFTRFGRAAAREALHGQPDTLRTVRGPDGAELFDLPDGPLPAADTPAPPRLMAMRDSTLLAHADRSRIIPPEYRPLVIRNNGDVLPTLLVDGHVAGVWRPAGGGVEGGIEATAFAPLPAAAWDGLAAEAAALAAFLADRDPAVYRRYARWWPALPAAETRVLPG